DRTGKAFDEGHNTDVWVVDAAGGALTKISDHDTADNSPRWSPDGRTIAFVSAVPEKSHPKIWLAPATGGPSHLAPDGLDVIPARAALGRRRQGAAVRERLPRHHAALSCRPGRASSRAGDRRRQDLPLAGHLREERQAHLRDQRSDASRRSLRRRSRRQESASA